MVEGDLLEISLEEKEQLRSILKQFHVAYKGLFLGFPVGDIYALYASEVLDTSSAFCEIKINEQYYLMMEISSS